MGLEGYDEQWVTIVAIGKDVWKRLKWKKYKAVSSEWVPNYWIFNLIYSGGSLKFYYLLTFKDWRVHTKSCLYSFLLKVRRSYIDLWSQQMSPQKEHSLTGTSGFSFITYLYSWHKIPDFWTCHLWSSSLFHKGQKVLQKSISYPRYLHSLADIEKKLYMTVINHHHHHHHPNHLSVKPIHSAELLH